MSEKKVSTLIRDNDGWLVNGGVLRNCDDVSPRLESDASIEVATTRVFVVGDRYLLSDLKKLTKSFGLKWNFVTYRTGARFLCNRANRSSKRYVGPRKYTSITCGCGWGIRFVGFMKNMIRLHDFVVITGVDPVHSNSCDPTYVDQFVICRTRSGDYARCGDEVIREVMVQMEIDPFVSVRAMTSLLRKALPDRKNVDRHMINNVRIRARKKKLDLDSRNIPIDTKHFDTSFVKSYIDTDDNYTEGKILFVVY